MKKDIKDFVDTCNTYKQQKEETIRIPDLLQPLSIPATSWFAILMDFIKELLTLGGKSTILMVDDMLTKYVQFSALAHPLSASTVA